jgi:hypothetical protein
MKPKNSKFIVLIVFYFMITGLSAQESISTTGGNALGNGGSASFSIGEVAYQTITSTYGSVAQGVQQPYEIYLLTGIEDYFDINLSVSAYPNPTTSDLILEVRGLDFSTINFQLFDMSGKLLQNEQVSSNQTRICMNNLVPASYFVKVYINGENSKNGLIQKNKVLKTFKIIKN